MNALTLIGEVVKVENIRETLALQGVRPRLNVGTLPAATAVRDATPVEVHQELVHTHRAARPHRGRYGHHGTGDNRWSEGGKSTTPGDWCTKATPSGHLEEFNVLGLTVETVVQPPRTQFAPVNGRTR